MKQNKKKPHKIHLYKKTDWTAVKSFLKSAEEVFYQNLPHENSVKENWQFFRDTILQAIEKFVPTKRASGRYYLPWMTRPIKRLLHQKQRAYNKAKKTNKDRDWALFRKLRKKSQSDLKTAHWDYLNTILTEDDNNKGLWRYLKGTRKDSCGVSTLASGDQVWTTPRDKSEMLNTQFSSVFTRENRWNVPPAKPSLFPKMPPIRIASAGVSKLLGQLNQKKACGDDNIPAVLLKHCTEELSPKLSFIIQQSLDTKTVPDDWKRALVTLIFKKGARSKLQNYRLVSLTAICCKVAEHIIVSQTMGHLDLHNILVDCQHGFCRKCSCETQLLITTHDLAAILNRHSQADVAVLEFAKAFDKVPHHRLLRKLKYYNLDNNVVGWVSSFLTGRTQRVVVEGYTSSEAVVLSGEPQGTVLGPLLFLVFIKDIIQGSSSSIHIFADDCLV